MYSNNNINNKLISNLEHQEYQHQEQPEIRDYTNSELLCISVYKCCPLIILILFGLVMSVSFILVVVKYYK